MNETVVYLLDFINELVKNIAWPLVILLIVLFIKKELFKVLQRISKLKFQDFEAELTIVNENLQELEQTKQKANKNYLKIFIDSHEVLQEEPRKAIIRSWSIFEKLLAEKYPEYNKGNAIVHMTIPSLMNNLQENKIITNNISDSVLELFRIRNKTLHLRNEYEITVEDAKFFLANIEKLYEYFDLLK